ncbi:MAG: translation initiation factor IF-2 [Leptolyngbya sp. DLM2.Bin15]|nr:MAG: translation initiation factor IF-2 [Leptolyngbya sp. DLM2.Bin15]
MGFADLSIVEIAEDHHLSVDNVFRLCDRLQISYKTPQTRLALEDVKAIIELIAQEGGPPSS